MLQNIRTLLTSILCTTGLYMASFSAYAVCLENDRVVACPEVTVPEPSILSLFALGVVGILVPKKFRK